MNKLIKIICTFSILTFNFHLLAMPPQQLSHREGETFLVKIICTGSGKFGQGKKDSMNGRIIAYDAERARELARQTNSIISFDWLQKNGLLDKILVDVESYANMSLKLPSELAYAQKLCTPPDIEYTKAASQVIEKLRELNCLSKLRQFMREISIYIDAPQISYGRAFIIVISLLGHKKNFAESAILDRWFYTLIERALVLRLNSIGTDESNIYDYGRDFTLKRKDEFKEHLMLEIDDSFICASAIEVAKNLFAEIDKQLKL